MGRSKREKQENPVRLYGKVADRVSLFNQTKRRVLLIGVMLSPDGSTIIKCHLTN